MSYPTSTYDTVGRTSRSNNLTKSLCLFGGCRRIVHAACPDRIVNNQMLFSAARLDNHAQGNSGKVEEHIQAGRRIVSLGESLAHAQHMMATSGEDTYDHTVKQFLRHTDIDVRSFCIS